MQNITPPQHRDALGALVVLGKTYGYTISSSGITHVVVGKALKFTEKYVTLKLDSRTSYVYGGLSSHQDKDYKPTASVYSCNLFPVKDSDVQPT